MKWIGIGLLGLLGLLALLLLVRQIGVLLRRRVPKGGINETRYVDINGTRQWISIYGKNKDNPVLLYLHGGPGGATSYIDYIVLRRLAGEYTVVSWDQRNSGKSWVKGQSNGDITAAMMIADGAEMTRFLLRYLGREKLTLLGISWGSIFGANLALRYPEYYDAFLAASLAIDPSESGVYFKEHMKKEAENDPEMLALAEQLDPYGDLRAQTESIVLPLADRYGYDDAFRDTDCDLIPGLIFNPNMSLRDWWRFFRTSAYRPSGYQVHQMLFDASLKDRLEYQIPFYLLEGTRDHGFLNMNTYAADYYARVTAPDKELRWVEGGHMMPMLNSAALLDFVREIRRRTI